MHNTVCATDLAGQKQDGVANKQCNITGVDEQSGHLELESLVVAGDPSPAKLDQSAAVGGA